MGVKEDIAAKVPPWRERVERLATEHGDVVVDQVTIAQIYGGMRGVKALVSDISYVDPQEGIRLRGYTIPEVLEKLPKPNPDSMPWVGGLYYLLLVGDVPTAEQALQVEAEWKARSEVPAHVFEVLKAMPREAHPMTLLSQAVLALEPRSAFSKRYVKGMRREQYWEPMLEDSLDLTAKLPAIAAFIYSLEYLDGQFIPPDPELDWGANFAHMMRVEDPEYRNLSRLYFILHSDHESGNVSAHAVHLTASTLANIYNAFCAGMNGLAGPLHGLANQECLRWLLNLRAEFGGVPTQAQLRDYAWDTLKRGQVIPGYGHPVLRKTDPRFTAQFEFAREHMPDDELFRLATLVYEVVPEVLKEQGKARNPWANVDALSGTLQYHYGVREFEFYTVMFGVGRSLGVTANTVWARALGQPIERPKSLTTAMLEEIAEKQRVKV